MTSTIRSALDREENQIKDDILRMGSLVETAVERVVAVELERMVDHATGIATITLRMPEQPLLKPLIDVPLMLNIAREMIRGAWEAFIRQDAEMARQAAMWDDEVDDLYQQVFRELLSYMLEDPKNIGRVTHLWWVAYNLERIADQATQLWERAIFISTGQLADLDV